MKRNIELTIETATRWYNGSNEELKQLALQAFPDLGVKELPKSWEQLKRVEGWFTNLTSETYDCRCLTTDSNKAVFKTKEQAEASIALAQLSQLRDVYRNGWVPDWGDGHEYKHIIEYYRNDLEIECYCNGNYFLSFQDKPTAELFLENFRDLIEQAKPLMS